MIDTYIQEEFKNDHRFASYIEDDIKSLESSNKEFLRRLDEFIENNENKINKYEDDKKKFLKQYEDQLKNEYRQRHLDNVEFMKKKASMHHTLNFFKFIFQDLTYLLPFFMSVGIVIYCLFKFNLTASSNFKYFENILNFILFCEISLCFIMGNFMISYKLMSKTLQWKTNYSKRMAPSLITLIITLSATGALFYFFNIVSSFSIKYINKIGNIFAPLIFLVLLIILLVCLIKMIMTIKQKRKYVSKTRSREVDKIMEKKFKKYQKKYNDRELTYNEFYYAFLDYKVYSSY